MVSEIKREPNHDAIKILEELLALAQAGELTELAAAGNISSEGNFFRGAAFNDRWRMIGALEYAKSAIDRSD